MRYAPLSPRPGIDQIAPYVAAQTKVPGFDSPLLLANNESPFPPSIAVRNAAGAALANGNRYPDGAATRLREEVAKRFELESHRVLAGSGSEELLQYVCRSFVKDGDEVLISQYGFVMYPIIARSVGALPVTAAEKDFHVDVDAFLAGISAATRLIFLTNPANPAGTYVSRSELQRLIRGIRPDVLLVVDEAYAEFVRDREYASALAFARDAPNVVVTRTFSKIYGLGGWRVGWAYAPPAVASAVNKIRLPFNVSTVAQAAALAALEDETYLTKVRNDIAETREWTVEQLEKLGVSAPRSVTNFILPGFGTTATAEAVTAHMKSRGILVRPMHAYRLGDRLRVTIGLREQMEVFVAALREFFADRSSDQRTG